LSGTASNYDLPRMAAGIGLATISLVLVCIHALSQQQLLSIDSVVFTAMIAAYGGMMFASSYVEEEQHFWYWSTTGWAAFLYCRRCVS
jgi:ethanolaminephosphotransferase